MLRRKSRQDVIENCDSETEQDFKKTNSTASHGFIPAMPQPRQQFRRQLSQNSKETKKLGARVISQKFRHGVIKGIRTKDELLTGKKSNQENNDNQPQTGQNFNHIQAEETNKNEASLCINVHQSTAQESYTPMIKGEDHMTVTQLPIIETSKEQHVDNVSTINPNLTEPLYPYNNDQPNFQPDPSDHNNRRQNIYTEANMDIYVNKNKKEVSKPSNSDVSKIYSPLHFPSGATQEPPTEPNHHLGDNSSSFRMSDEDVVKLKDRYTPLSDLNNQYEEKASPAFRDSREMPEPDLNICWDMTKLDTENNGRLIYAPIEQGYKAQSSEDNQASETSEQGILKRDLSSLSPLEDHISIHIRREQDIDRSLHNFPVMPHQQIPTLDMPVESPLKSPTNSGMFEKIDSQNNNMGARNIHLAEHEDDHATQRSKNASMLGRNQNLPSPFAEKTDNLIENIINEVKNIDINNQDGIRCSGEDKSHSKNIPESRKGGNINTDGYSTQYQDDSSLFTSDCPVHAPHGISSSQQFESGYPLSGVYHYMPFQYYGHYYPQPLYTHPANRSSVNVQSQSQIRHPAPGNLQFQYNYPPPYGHNNFPPVPDFAASAFIKWQQDYAQWYKSYTEMSSRLSRQSSFMSSTHNNAYPDPLLQDNESTYSHGRFSNIGSSNAILNAQTPITAEHGRETPPLFSAAHVRAGFSHANLLVTFSESSAFIWKIDAFLGFKNIAFPGPLSSSSNQYSLLKFIEKSTESMTNSDSSIKLLWQIFRTIIKSENSSCIYDIADTLFSYNPRLRVSSQLSNAQTSLTESNHFNILSSLMFDNAKNATTMSYENNNWALALALSSLDPDLHKATLRKYIESLDSRDLLRIFLSVHSKIPIDMSFLNDKEVLNGWNVFAASFLSLYAKDPSSSLSYLENISKILYCNGKWIESNICLLILELVIGVEIKEPPAFYPQNSLKHISMNLSSTDLLYLRTMEIYEFIKLLRKHKFSFPFLQIFKFIYAEIISETTLKETSYEYVQLITRSILSDCISEYSHGFLHRLFKLSRRLHHILFFSNNYPDWLIKLGEIVTNYQSLVSDEPSHNSELQNLQSMEIIGIDTPVINSTTCEPKSVPLNSVESVNTFVEVFDQPNIPTKQTHPDLIVKPIVPTLQTQISENTNNDVKQQVTQPPLPFYAANDFAQKIPKIQPISILTAPNNNILNRPPAPHSTLSTIQHHETTIPKGDKIPDYIPSATAEPVSNINVSEKPSEDAASTKPQITIFSGASKIITKLFRSRNEIHLPDDSNPTLVFNKETNRYVDLSCQDTKQPESKLPPRTVASSYFTNPTSPYVVRPQAPRYITPKY